MDLGVTGLRAPAGAGSSALGRAIAGALTSVTGAIVPVGGGVVRARP